MSELNSFYFKHSGFNPKNNSSFPKSTSELHTNISYSVIIQLKQKREQERSYLIIITICSKNLQILCKTLH